ncbi:hypothetical protein [Gardnerella sp. KA00747]|uniref:hypothetical protein n=1 Tax=Gardnerella sp. KA00747 TaxID=2749078 RepID=UPI003BA96958
MSRRWDFGLISSERSLETKVKSTDLHIMGRNMAFELFPRTYEGKNRCVSEQKHALSNSRERTRIWLHTRHQDEAVEPARDLEAAEDDVTAAKQAVTDEEAKQAKHDAAKTASDNANDAFTDALAKLNKTKKAAEGSTAVPADLTETTFAAATAVVFAAKDKVDAFNAAHAVACWTVLPNFFSSQSSVVVVLCGFVECVASGFVDATRGVRETGGFFVFG